VARWALCWFLLIAVSTAGMYVGTNQLVTSDATERVSYAMLPLSELGSRACTSATRGLVAAADGNAPDATPERRDAYQLAAARVLAACAQT